MTRRLGSSFGIPALIPIALVGMLGLSGCPDNPYQAKTWTKKLGGREHERALQELEQLGDPAAIPDIGDAWEKGGKPGRDLQVIITLARPLTPAEAKAKFVTDYEEKGREANWSAAMPFLKTALTAVDDSNTRSVESATKAADAIGESKLSDGLDALIAVAVEKPVTKKLFPAQIASIRAIGNFDTGEDRAKAQRALVKLIDREPPPHPKTIKGKDQKETEELKRAANEKFGMFLATTGAAINALGELQTETAAKTLILSLYRTPELATQVRRALVATGPSAKEELKQILMGQNKEVEALFAQKSPINPRGLGWYCGDTGELPPDKCAEVGMRDFYAALVLGDFYDPATSKQLLAALKKPPAPAYFVDDNAGPPQYNAIFDALRKIGSADAAATVRDMWLVKKKDPPKRGQKDEGAGEPDLQTRILAVSAYPFLTRDNVGVKELGEIAADNQANDDLRRAAAEAFARVARSEDDVKILEVLADKYFKASAEKRKEADGKPKADAEAADKVLAAERKKNDEAKAAFFKITKDDKKTAAEIRAATAATKKAEEEFKLAKKKHRDATMPYKNLDNASKAYKGFARMFQTHIARIEIAIRCKQEMECYAKALEQKPDDVAAKMKRFIKDVDTWDKNEKLGLLEGSVERAMLEIGKKGSAAASYVDLLLDHAKSDNRIIRQSILLALPKIASLPCDKCALKLDAAIKAAEGKTTLGELNLETTMLRHYFAGGKKLAGGSAAVEAPPEVDTPKDAPKKK